MVHLWKKTIEIDNALAEKLIEQQFSFNVNQISALDEGWDNTAFLVNNEIIFRFPHREFGLKCMQHEIELLPKISSYLSFQATVPKYIGKPSDLFPYSFAGYQMIVGAPLCDATNDLIDDHFFAKQLATWLKELHSIPVKAICPNLNIAELCWQFDIPHRIKRCYENLESYKNYFSNAGFDRSELIEVIEKIKLFRFENTFQSVLHGDLYCRHVIVNENLQPAGLIDFGDIFIGDPGIDLSVGMIFSENAFKVFLNTYGDVDQTRLRILLFHAFAHALSFLPYTYEQEKVHLQQWAALELRRSIVEIQKIQIE